MTLECPTYNEQQVYTCQQQVGQGDGCCQQGFGGWGACCDIGCCSCPDDELEGGMRVSTSGRRWMRPHPTLSNRDAEGKQTPLHSNMPIRVPRFVHFQRAACYDMFGKEHWGRDVCDCHPAPATSPEPGEFTCPGGEQIGEIIRGDFPDCTAHTGHEYTGPANWMWCRHVEKHDEADVRLLVGPMLETAFARTDQQTPHTDSACAPNAITWCTQRAPDSPCREPWCSGGVCYYNDNVANRNVFSEVEMDWGAGSSSELPQLIAGAMITDQAMLDLKNAAIERALTATFPDGSPLGVKLDRLNISIDDMSKWSRGYESFDGTTACEDLVVVAPLLKSFFVHTHEPANVDLVITNAFAQLHLVPYTIDTAPAGQGRQPETLPYARVNVEVGCRARVRLADGTCHLLPSPDVGPIIFEDREGRRLAQVPRKCEWFGYLGHFSDPPTENVETEPDQGGGRTRCCQIAEDLSTVVVPGWPAFAGSRPSSPNQLYVGRVRLDFTGDIWESACNAP